MKTGPGVDPALRVVDAIADGEKAKQDQRRNLDDVDCQVDGRRGVCAALGDGRDKECKDVRNHRHEDGTRSSPGHEGGIEKAHYIPDEYTGDADHHARVDPVVEVRAPADNKLGDAALLSQVLQARALHGEAIEHGQLFAARAAGHPTPMDLFGPVLGLPIGFEIGSEKAERMQRGGRAVTIRSYAVLSIVAFFASMPTGVGLTPQTGGLCGKPPSAFWWLPLWLSNPPPTTSVSSASPVGPVGPVAVSAPPISLSVRRRSWRDPPRLSCGASVGPQDLFRLPWPSAGPDRAGRVAL